MDPEVVDIIDAWREKLKRIEEKLARLERRAEKNGERLDRLEAKQIRVRYPKGKG